MKSYVALVQCLEEILTLIYAETDAAYSRVAAQGVVTTLAEFERWEALSEKASHIVSSIADTAPSDPAGEPHAR